MVKVGLVGTGRIGGVHARAIRESGLGELVSVYSPGKSAPAFAAERGARVAATSSEFFADPEISAVVIASPTASHLEYMRQAADAGKHVLCEKPLARTEEDLEALARFFKNTKLVVAVAHVIRYFPLYQHIQEVLAKGTLGQIGTIRLGRAGCMPVTGPWAANFKDSGGVIYDLMIHDLYALRMCFGDIERVFAMRSASENDIHNDYAVAVARMADGAIAHLEASWVEPPETFYYYAEIAGSKGILEFDSRAHPTTRRYNRNGGVEPVSSNPGPFAPYTLQMRDFLQAVKTGGETKIPLNDGIIAARMALGALESAATGQPVELADAQKQGT